MTQSVQIKIRLVGLFLDSSKAREAKFLGRFVEFRSGRSTIS
jgi:hypothetical protein